MKRILFILAIVFFTANAFAAEGVAWSSRRVHAGYNTEWLEITAIVTCAANGSFTTVPLYEDETDETNTAPAKTAGFFLHSVSTYFGATPPTDNSDLELLEHSATGYDVLVGAGSNIIDNAANNFATTLIGTIPHPVPIFGTLYMKITQAAAATANATFTIVFKFTRIVP